MSDDLKTHKPGGGACGCWWLVGIMVMPVVLICGGLGIRSLWVPYFQKPRPITLTVLNKAGTPISGAEVQVFESDYFTVIPILVMRSMMHTSTYHTNAQGQVRFEVKYRGANLMAVKLNGESLMESTASTVTHLKDGKTREHGSVSWYAQTGEGVTGHSTTVVVAPLRRR